MTELRSQLRYARSKFVEGVVVAAFLTVVVGPPVWVVYQIAIGTPLWGSRTVTETITRTEYYGIIPEAGGMMVIWFMVLLIGYGLASGTFPRGFH